MYNITHIFEIDGNYYALDYRNMFFCLLDKDTYEAFNDILSGVNRTKNITKSFETLSDLTKHGFFLSEHSDSPVSQYGNDTLNISFAPVHDCNFACTYCYANGGKGTSNYQMRFDEKKIDRLLDYIYIEKYSYYPKYKFDFVSGGEPLLHFPILEYFLNKIRHYDKVYGKKTTVLLVTNGTLLTEEIIKRLDLYDIFLGISIDGTEEVHNRHRVYRNGSGTYVDVVKGISMLRKSSGTSSKIKDAWAMSVISRQTGSLVDLMENCIDLGFSRMQMQLVRLPREHTLSFREKDLIDLKENYKKLFSHILLFAAKGDLSRLKMIANDNDSFGKFMGRLLLRKPTCYRCFAGKNKIAVTASGEIFPCDSFCGNKDFCIGSIHNSMDNNSVVKLFQEAHIQNRVRCRECWAHKICGGDCFYNSYMINGNIYDPDPYICEMNRFFIEHTIDLLIKLKAMNADYITYMTKFFERQ